MSQNAKNDSSFSNGVAGRWVSDTFWNGRLSATAEKMHFVNQHKIMYILTLVSIIQECLNKIITTSKFKLDMFNKLSVI